MVYTGQQKKITTHDANVRIAIVGAGGRIGRQLVQAALTLEGVWPGTTLERGGSSSLGSGAGELAGVEKAGITVQSSLDVIEDDLNVFIDFTRPKGTPNHLAFYRQHGEGMVIDAMGLDEAGRQTIRDTAADVAVVLAANFSAGVNVILKLPERATKVMGGYADIEIIEAYHRHKVDAPSGITLTIGEAIAHALDKNLRDCAVCSHEGHTDECVSGTTGFATMCTGDITGEHTAMFADVGKHLEITRKASSHTTSANGTVRSALWLSGKENGLLDIQDVLGLSDL